MAKRRMAIMALLLWVCLCVMPCTALAASTVDAVELINPQQACDLSIYYRYGDVAFKDVPVALYRIADVSADFQYTLTLDYAPTNLVLNGISSNAEWNTVRATLEAFILVNHYVADYKAVTDATGLASFEDLKPGLYLAIVGDVVQDDLTCTFDAALVALPGLGTDGRWQYDVTVTSKPQMLPPIDPDEELEMKVLKLWKGDSGKNTRPTSVKVEIFKDSVSYQTVILSKENNWSYSWSVPDDGAKWLAKECDVPDGYVATLNTRGTTITLTNTYYSDEPPAAPPPTGDTSNMLLYIVLMFTSGALFIILGMTGKRNRHEETT